MGFLPTIVIEMYAEFQLKVKENKGVFFFWPFMLKDPMSSIHELLGHPRIAGYCSTRAPLSFSLPLGLSLLWPFHSGLPGFQLFLKHIRYSLALGFVPSTRIPSSSPSSLCSNLNGS